MLIKVNNLNNLAQIMHFFKKIGDYIIMPTQINFSKNDTSQNFINNLNEFVIKIDYFDQEGTKSFEDNIPLKYIFNSLDMKLTETNLEQYY